MKNLRLLSYLEKGQRTRIQYPQSYKDSENMSTELYENITQELKEIMPFELYLPVTDNPKVTDREPKTVDKTYSF